MARVFISSTCYDLVDVRAELKAVLEEMGFDALLSEDDLNSAFEVSGDVDKNSIQECLDNVNTCDCFLLILSQRYGPPLAKAGFDDVSATHLEYREFVKRRDRGERVKLFVYVRDRLAQDYDSWKANGRQSMRHPWILKDADRMFAFLEEVAKLNAHEGKDGTNNWFSRFRDSTRLRDLVRRHLNALSPPALLARLVRDRRIAILCVVPSGVGEANYSSLILAGEEKSGVKIGEKYETSIRYKLENLGDVAALNIRAFAQAESTMGVDRIRVEVARAALLPGSATELMLFISGICVESAPGDEAELTAEVYFEYMLPTGEDLRDQNRITFAIRVKTQDFGYNLRTCWYFLPSNECYFVGKELVRAAQSP